MDIIFKDRDAYELASRSGIFTKELFAGLYGIPVDKVINIVDFDQARAIKATVVRPIVSGDPGDGDVYGAQQHAPLLTIKVPLQEV